MGRTPMRSQMKNAWIISQTVLTDNNQKSIHICENLPEWNTSSNCPPKTIAERRETSLFIQKNKEMVTTTKH